MEQLDGGGHGMSNPLVVIVEVGRQKGKGRPDSLAGRSKYMVQKGRQIWEAVGRHPRETLSDVLKAVLNGVENGRSLQSNLPLNLYSL